VLPFLVEIGLKRAYRRIPERKLKFSPNPHKYWPIFNYSSVSMTKGLAVLNESPPLRQNFLFRVQRFSATLTAFQISSA